MAEWQDGRIRWEMYHSIPNVLLGDLLRDYSMAKELINNFTRFDITKLSRRNKAGFREFTGSKVGVYCLKSPTLLSPKSEQRQITGNQIDRKSQSHERLVVNIVYKSLLTDETSGEGTWGKSSVIYTLYLLNKEKVR